ncbi:transposase [Streptomyces sp. NPDC006706]|uniref:transposase n=1 Tax=Streptomyces sp. NPDC006706 TaxID=3364761 RepID=UPI0036A3F06D
MLDAVRYVVDNGVKWANLPADFPPYRRVHAFVRRWQVTGLFAEFHDRLRDRVREKEGRAVDPTAAIVESQSVRAAANIPRSTSGWDGGKKVGGRHLTRRFEADLLLASHAVVRVHTRLMAGARCSARERGKPDPIDAEAVARRRAARARPAPRQPRRSHAGRETDRRSPSPSRAQPHGRGEQAALVPARDRP